MPGTIPTTVDPTVATLDDVMSALCSIAFLYRSERIINWTTHEFLFYSDDYETVRALLPGIGIDEATGYVNMQTHIGGERWR